MPTHQNRNRLRICLNRSIQPILEILLVGTTIIYAQILVIRILDDWNDKFVEKSKISVLPRITTWNPLNHLLILDFEGFIV